MGRTPWRGTAQQHDDPSVIDESMQRVEIARFADRDSMALSGGESGRMSLARVLAQQAPVVLLDEPAAALDVRYQEATMAIARQIADEGGSAVVVSHDLDSAVHWSDRIALLENGRLRAEGRPSEALSSRLLSDVYETPIEMFEHPATGRLVVRPVR